MTIAEIREIIQLFNESGVAEIEVQRGENRLRLTRAPFRQDLAVPPPPPLAANFAASATPPPPAVPAPSLASSAATLAPKPSEADANVVLVKSPIVGTFYEQPSPGAPAFVKVGDAVEPGQVLCIIESMKLMNEIEAETSGIVAAKLVENGRPVEYGEALFAIRPR